MPPMGPHGNTDFKKPKNAKKTFGRILQYMGKSKMLLFVVFIMLVLSTVCSIGASYCLKPILDGVAESIKNASFDTEGKRILITNLAQLSALYIGAAIFSFVQSKIMVKSYADPAAQLF